MEPLLILQGAAVALAVIGAAAAYLTRSDERQAIEKATGGRIRATFRGRVLEAQPKGLALSVLLQQSGDQSHYNVATVSVAVSLSPQAEFYVGPRNPFSKPIEQLFSGLPPVRPDIPWLKDWETRGAPEKAALEVLSRVSNLEDFRESGWKPKHLACKADKLELAFETRWNFEPSNLKALVELSADLAFKLMG